MSEIVRYQEVDAKEHTPLQIQRLLSGGLITTYTCTSSCRHCLYHCSPNREKRFMDSGTATAVLSTIIKLGCRSIHIGGGEPMLNLPSLETILDEAGRLGVNVEYVETNSSWFRTPDQAAQTLRRLKDRGLTTLLISISPFHTEFIPFRKVQGVINACKETGLAVFPWIGEFKDEVQALDPDITHDLSEYMEWYGHDYIESIPARYWIHYGGRALKLFMNIYGGTPWREILTTSNRNCTELRHTDHFHIDLNGDYIPGLCAGLSIRMDDLDGPLDPKRYPLITVLFNEGINGLFELAAATYGFQPRDKYLNKCDMCTHIRDHMVNVMGVDSRELQPRGFYNELTV